MSALKIAYDARKRVQSVPAAPSYYRRIFLRILRRLRLQNPDLALGGDDEAARPFADVFILKEFDDPIDQISAVRRVKPNQHQAMMRTRKIFSRIRKIQILSDEDARFLLCYLPDLGISRSREILVIYGINFMA
jgi:hypothetical protein